MFLPKVVYEALPFGQLGLGALFSQMPNFAFPSMMFVLLAVTVFFYRFSARHGRKLG